jgi:phasin family protein
MNTSPKQDDETIEVASDVSKTALQHFEKLINLQFKAARNYADLALNNTRAALEVKDLDDAKGYLEKQAEVARDVLASIAKDSEEAVALGRDYAESMESLLKKSAVDATAAKNAD